MELCVQRHVACCHNKDKWIAAQPAMSAALPLSLWLLSFTHLCAATTITISSQPDWMAGWLSWRRSGCTQSLTHTIYCIQIHTYKSRGICLQRRQKYCAEDTRSVMEFEKLSKLAAFRFATWLLKHCKLLIFQANWHSRVQLIDVRTCIYHSYVPHIYSYKSRWKCVCSCKYTFS